MHQHLSVEDAAALLGVSVSRMARMVERDRECTPTTYAWDDLADTYGATGLLEAAHGLSTLLSYGPTAP